MGASTRHSTLRPARRLRFAPPPRLQAQVVERRRRLSADFTHNQTWCAPEFARKPRPFQSRPIPVPDRWRPWLHQELDRAIAAGAYEEATCFDFVAPAFIIEQRNKLRLVIDFRQINKSCIQ